MFVASTMANHVNQMGRYVGGAVSKSWRRKHRGYKLAFFGGLSAAFSPPPALENKSDVPDVVAGDIESCPGRKNANIAGLRCAMDMPESFAHFWLSTAKAGKI